MSPVPQLNIDLFPVTEGSGWLGWTLCGTVDEDGFRHEHASLLCRWDNKTVSYYTVNETEVFTIPMHELFDFSTTQSVIDSLVVWHRDFLNQHGITVPMYDAQNIVTLALPDHLLEEP